ncbi:MAG: TonB-dependent receptor [Acidobacteriota bacterium]|nr:TonB-dependent receptor [Acidobacteriota bacterium]
MAPWVVALLLTLGQFGQSNTGELRVTVTDSSGLPLPGPVEVVSDANEFHQRIETDSAGMATVRRLPFGSYRVAIARSGFASVSRLVEIRSALPAEYHVTMSLATVQAQITVSADTTLVDPHQATSVHRIGAETLERRTSALPGRALPDIVNTQPGWLLEANGILHPRGSEYQTQYVVDGLPVTDNRSPVFAPELGADDVQAMTILTGGYPAEYGRKLGGVIEIVTMPDARRGFGGSVSASLGSFRTGSGDAIVEHGGEKSTLSVTVAAAGTGRYLDPPVEENHTNHGSTTNGSLRYERDVTASTRFGVILRHGNARFLVPNEHVQQEAGQRQDRSSAETAAQFSAQRIFSPNLVGDVRGMVRDVSAQFWSNTSSTPIVASQNRGFRELYVKGALSAHAGVHEVKAGADVSVGHVREDFSYRITDPRAFDDTTPGVFSFAGRHADREEAVFIQDQMRMGVWTVNAGLRWDRYALVVRDNAFSPRLAAAWSWPAADMVLRGSYDRVFQTPAIENLLIASSESVERLGNDVVRLPVPPSRGDFYEAGLSKAIAGRIRLDLAFFKRRMTDVADDDLLLNTGVSFPIAFRRAEINGAEIKLELRRWKRLSGSIGYSHLHGVGELPITGGLFLGEEATGGLTSTERFPVTQDQRHTIRGRASYQFSSSGWIALAGSYGSGLPFENFDDTPADAVEQFGQRVVDRVNFETRRVRPSASLDVSAGFAITKSPKRALRLQAEVRNLTNRLDVINFAGLFSGTALAAPRSVAVRLRLDLR